MRGQQGSVMLMGVGTVAIAAAAVLAVVTAGHVPEGPSSSDAGWSEVGQHAPDLRDSAIPALPRVSGDVGIARFSPELPAPTNRWYSGMLFGATPQPVFAMPLALLADDHEISIGLPTVTATATNIAGPFAPQFRVGLPTTSFAATRADPVSLTTMYSSDGAPVGRLQVAEGWPYVAYTAESDQSLSVPAGLTTREGGWVSADVGGSTYGIAIAGADGEPQAVTVSDDQVDLAAGESILAFGAPDADTAATLATGAVPVTGTKVTYRLADGAAHTRIRYDTLGDRPTVIAAMPHHRLDDPAETVGTVDSVYGPMRLYRGNTLTTSVREVTPQGTVDLRGLTARDRGELRRQVTADVSATVRGPASPTDSYFGGKAAYRLAQLYRIARSVGADGAADLAHTRLVADLDAWLHAEGCTAGSTRCFAYDPAFRGVVGRAASFGSDLFNDHHFHYGYFLAAAALVAEVDPSVVADWRPTLDALADDIAAPSSGSTVPAMRNFDPYAGHSWASGLAPFADGNNQESSSEAVSAWNGLALWGGASGEMTRARQATWQLSLESATASAYWLEPAGLPPAYEHPFVSLNWGGKRDWATWFSADPSAILGIQLIPMPPTFDQGRPTAARVHENLADATPDGYRVAFGDYLTMYLATVDPHRALRIGRNLPDSSIDDGDSRSYLLAWLLAHRRA